MEMASTEKNTIHGLGEVSNIDANARPAPIEFPDWKEIDTTNILMPIKYETIFPYRFRMVSIKVFWDENPKRVDMVVNTIMNTVDSKMIQSKLY